MKQIAVCIPEEYLKGLDELVRKGLYPHRAEAIRLAIRDLILLHKEDCKLKKKKETVFIEIEDPIQLLGGEIINGDKVNIIVSKLKSKGVKFKVLRGTLKEEC